MSEPQVTTQVQDNQNQLQMIKITDTEKAREIISEIEQKLMSLMKPKVYRLRIIPDKIIVPMLQKLRDAPYKLYSEFKKYYCPEFNYLAFVHNKGEAVLVVTEYNAYLYFITRTTKRVYEYVLTPSDVRRILPEHLSFYVVDDAEIIHRTDETSSFDEPILREFFALSAIIYSDVLKIGNIYLIKVSNVRNFEKWEKGHEYINEIKDYACKLTNEIYYYTNLTSRKVNDEEIPAGEWLIYRPREDKVD